jgi:hypothetical protein
MLQRFLDSGLGDFVKNDTLQMLVLTFDKLGNMPCNCFTFAVGVGCKQYGVGFLCFTAQFLDDLLFACGLYVVWYEAPLNVDGIFITLGEVAHVADRCTHGVARAQIFFDSLCFRGRLDDNESFCCHSHNKY